MRIIPAEAMPFCGEVSCHGEDRRHSQTGHKDTKEGGKVHLNGSILSPAGAGCWLGLFERIFFYAVKSREQDALRTGRGFFFFFFFNPLGEIHGAVITLYLNLLPRSGTVSF